MIRRIVEFSKADDLVFALTEEVCKPRKISHGEVYSLFSAACDNCGASLDSKALMMSATMIVTIGRPTVPRCPRCAHDHFVATLVGVTESDLERLRNHKFFATLANPEG